MFEFLRAPLTRQRGQKQTKSKKRLERVRLSGREVEIFRRPYRRRLSMTLKPSGRIRIAAPAGAPLSDIAKFMESNAEWIEKTLSGYRKLRESFPEKRYNENEEFLFLGRRLKLKFERARNLRPRVFERDGFLIVASSAELKSSESKRVIARFYESAGRERIADRVREFSSRMQLRYSKLSFRSQKTRWGSCSSKGALSFNWRLAIASPEVIDYVVVHELAHLKHYNHSNRFWALVETQIPDYRKTRHWLSEHQYEADFLAKRSELHELD